MKINALRRPSTALTLSLFWPGLGQIYNRQAGYGIVALIVNTTLYAGTIPYQKIGRIIDVSKECAIRIESHQMDVDGAVAAIQAAVETPMPWPWAWVLGLSAMAALSMHAYVTWHAWRTAKQSFIHPLPSGEVGRQYREPIAA